MSGVLAIPTFVGGARDALATADVYQQSGRNVINSISGFMPSFDNNLAALALRGGKTLLGNLPMMGDLTSLLSTTGISSMVGLASKALGGLGSLGGMGSLTGLGGSLMGLGSNLNLNSVFAPLSPMVANASRMLSSGLGNQIYGNMQQTMARLPSFYELEFGPPDMRQMVKMPYDGLVDARGMGDVINSFGCSSPMGIYDRYGNLGMMSGVLYGANRMGMPGAWGCVTAGATDENFLLQLAGQALPSILNASDLPSLKQMAGMFPTGTLRQMNPNVIGDYGRQYQNPYQCSIYDRVDQYGQVIDTFNTIDPRWNQYRRGGNDVLDFSQLMNGNVDFKQLVGLGARMAGDSTQQLYGLINHLDLKSPMESLRSQFPNTVFSDSGNSFQFDTDPRVDLSDTSFI